MLLHPIHKNDFPWTLPIISLGCLQPCLTASLDLPLLSSVVVASPGRNYIQNLSVSKIANATAKLNRLAIIKTRFNIICSSHSSKPNIYSDI